MANSILDIKEILEEYSYEIQEGITEDAIQVAKEGVKTLKSTSPKRTGDYAKGWRVKTEKGTGYIKCTIHNKTHYRLTHLLEKPHAKRNGGKTTPKVHIAPVEKECIDTYKKKVIETIKNGGNG